MEQGSPLEIDHQQLLKEHAELMEKNRALFSLYSIAQTMGNTQMSFEAKLKRIAKIVPQGFHYPENTGCTISTDRESVSSENSIMADSEDSDLSATMSSNADGYPDILPHLCERIFVNGVQCGKIEVFQRVTHDTNFKKVVNNSNTLPRDDDAKPPFNKEEKNLLRTVARHLAVIMERRESDEKEADLMAQLHHSDRLAKTGELAAGIAHELNNPLGNILGYAQLAAKTQGLPIQVCQDLDRIIQITLHAREVIKKLMFFSRQVPPRTELIDIRVHLEHALQFMESMCNRSQVTVVRNYHESPTLFSFDPSQFIQIMMNLIMNALHAMPQGGTLTITTYEEEDSLCLIVKDSGIGMASETLRQIFTPFFTTRSLDQGTGLGLSVVHGILESHKASIDVTSEKGKGSSFKIRFPLPSNECFQ